MNDNFSSSDRFEGPSHFTERLPNAEYRYAREHVNVGGSITVRLVTSLSGLDSVALLHTLYNSVFYGMLKRANPDLFLFIFVLFSSQFQKYKLKKCRWCAWDWKRGPQDGRRRQNHGAMVATLLLHSLAGTLQMFNQLALEQHLVWTGAEILSQVEM